MSPKTTDFVVDVAVDTGIDQQSRDLLASQRHRNV